MNRTLTQMMDSGAVPPVIYVFVNGLGDTGYIDAPVPEGPSAVSARTSGLKKHSASQQNANDPDAPGG